MEENILLTAEQAWDGLCCDECEDCSCYGEICMGKLGNIIFTSEFASKFFPDTQNEFFVGDIVICDNITDENYEGLVKENYYLITGKSIIDSELVYSVKDCSGNTHCSINRFKLYIPVNVKDLFPKKDRPILEPTINNSDPINPEHYKAGGIETIDFIEAKFTVERLIGFLLGNVMKYVSRSDKKENELQDLKKAKWYLYRAIQVLEKQIQK